ncbi:hypothetical protein PtA15_15A208 [Puccinia triticina]|uniref:Uncharacterized protein n=1 Tax=Puccinia triticina TaxID=208348 RepID=A0ABY7D333_9BASI|nr:uncharacterized protein PtA15_15A208 [Puccinia triticina]WAQ91816.1 hypothetical protein PtA15_15A208 [Puccinia triticina]WAR62611.1 hypothetical protein PtB15_15B197 [Puccinia triticina]
MAASFAIEAGTNKFMGRVLIRQTFPRRNELENQQGLKTVIPIRKCQSMVYWFAESRKRY